MAFGNRISQIESTSIDLSFEGFAVFSNDEETRQFLVAKLSRTSNDALRDIRVSLDAILSQFDLPALYKEPQFHASFAWRDYDDGDSEWLLERLDTAFTADLRSQHIEIDCIKVKIGKDVTVVPLAQKLRGGRN
ncbi:protein of unknown function [Taphrina deformans PYCC 5710]|uniref:U6 snRNA phosphodiesterase 1 n=1 Tax=Taphrina deformans (strain PYCC 5710 / ATCC 11124 / CBS 356.35 / IMI 108563 / JCM 9778 / NBRC 8474) TaxID=1097556 RepID=R4XI15_TAPDE|nr:protein of unknown function [Taphrina deformans PYCC 5710]|eukprot:CCG83042.1 protein of unknown function [Taphrina deformans PYCC 5710]